MVRQASQQGWRARVLVALLTGVLVVLTVRVLPEFVSVEHWITDWRTALFSEVPYTQSDDVVLVTISEETLEGYPYVSPVNRNLLADLLERLDGMSANAVLIDIFFDRPTEQEADARLIDTIRNMSTPLVLGYRDESTLTAGQRRYQQDWIDATGRPFGYLNLARSNDGVVRHIPPLGEGQCAFVEAAYEGGCERGRGYRRIDWLLPPSDGRRTFAMIPAETLLDSDPSFLEPAIRGRAVIIGVTIPGVDQHRTPISDLYDAQAMPGVEIHAHVMQQLIDRRMINELNLLGEFSLFALGGLIGVVLSTYAVVRKRAALILFGLTWLLVATDIVLFVFLHLVVPGDAAAFAVIVGFIGASIHRKVTGSASSTLTDELGVLL